MESHSSFIDMEYQKVGTSSWIDCGNENTEVDPGTYIVRYKAKTNYNAGSPSAELVVNPFKATVSIIAGVNMTKTGDSGNAEQIVTSAITPVVYLANEGYYFPEGYAVDGQNGITVTRNSYTQITVSGTPTADVNMILIAPTAKMQELPPSVIFTATGTDEGKLTNVSSGMKYQIDSGDWNDIISSSDIELNNLSACTISIVKKGNGTTTTDSDAQTISVTKATTPNLTATQPSVIGGKGSIPMESSHEYKLQAAETWTRAGSTTALMPGRYLVRVAANGTVLASDAQTITIHAFIPDQEATPAAVFSAVTMKLTGVTSGMKYQVGTGAWTDITGSEADLSSVVTGACTIKVIKKGNGTTTTDSDAQTISVTKAITPNLTATQPSVIGGKGSIPMESSHEYKLQTAETWTRAGSTTALIPGTYLVRVAANGTVLASDAQTITIHAFIPGQETTPDATFFATGDTTGTLSGVENGMKYSTNGGSSWTVIDSTADINLTNLSACTISVIKNGNGTTTLDSEIQSIIVEKAAVPITATKKNCTTNANNDGKLQNVTTAMEYKKSDAGSWIDGTGSDITNLTNGTYFVRVKATGRTLASANQVLIIDAYSNGGSTGGGGGYFPIIQKPIIETSEGVNVDLSSDGTKAIIMVDEGYELADVVLNGESKGQTTEVAGLKTGDKLVVTAVKKQEEFTYEDIIGKLQSYNLVAYSKAITMKNGKKAIKINWYDKNGLKLDFLDGIEIYRSTKRNAGYSKKPIFTTKKGNGCYYNTSISVGIRYYYKVRGFVTINGEKIYTPYSMKAWRAVK